MLMEMHRGELALGDQLPDPSFLGNAVQKAPAVLWHSVQIQKQKALFLWSSKHSSTMPQQCTVGPYMLGSTGYAGSLGDTDFFEYSLFFV